MLEIQRTAFVRAINTLNNLNAQYKIILPDGDEYGTLRATSEPVKKRKTPSKFPLGALTAHFLPLINNLKPGECAIVPTSKYPAESIRGSLSAWVNTHWGAGSTMTSVNRVNNTLEVLRLS